MNGLWIALNLSLLVQAPGEANNYEPIRVPARQAAPAVDLGDPNPADAAPAADPAAGPPADPATASPFDAPAAQAPADAAPATDAAADQQPAGDMESLGNQPRQRLRPPELIAAALETPEQEAVAGTPITLAQALARATDRQRQLQITKAYWRLATAQAAYHWALERRDLVLHHTQQHAGRPDVLSAQAAAAADAGDARVAVEKAQGELATLIGTPGTAAPLSVDRPHVGEYRTYFENIFGGRSAPPPIWLIERTLPVRRKAIDAHGDAVVAASDAVEASAEQLQASGQGITTLLDALEALGAQRRAFISVVRDYNLDIADYAFAVAPPGAPSDTLVSMLIRKAPLSNTPTRAAGTPPHSTFRKAAPATDGAKLDSAHVDDWAANYPGDLDAGTEDSALYQALVELTSEPLRVQKLGNLLHWDRNLPEGAGEPIALADCLAASSGPDRRAIIDAFWQARQTAAALQAQGEKLEQLNALQAIAIPQRDAAGMAEAGVRLQASRRAARAAVLDAQAEFLAAQFRLMTATGRPLSGAWLVPSTTPQSGRYHMSARGRASAAAAAAKVASAFDKLLDRSQAVVQSDAHRAELTQQARRGETAPQTADGRMSPLDRAIWAIERQNRQTLAFLDDLTEYNRAIATYVLATQPASLSATELAGRLAIARSTLRDS
jgi:hypothetical protein